jgi:tRNA (mo5U34)-methyltransferase
MSGSDLSKLAGVRSRTWFYEFDLPTGEKTTCDLPASVIKIHRSRRDKLISVIDRFGDRAKSFSALDLGCHEGYFAIEMARRLLHVTGYDFRPQSIDAAKLIADVLNVQNVRFETADVHSNQFLTVEPADFILVFGLLYHVESPIKLLRTAAQLGKRHVLLETQVFPYDVSGRIEDGSYEWQRNVDGMFALTTDYPEGREGGSTDLALVPSLNAVKYLLRHFGFPHVEVIAPTPDDYEQYRRGSRVVVLASRSSA